MLVKFFDTGKGSARSAFQYLLNKERVANGTAELLSGSPEAITFLTEQRMKSASYRGGSLYTSGVLSFSEKEHVTDSDLDLIIERFKEAMFPKLDHSRFNMAFIKHNDKNRLEVHFVIQNFDLDTKKTITPFVKERDLSRINAFKDLVNLEFNLIDPNLNRVHFLVKNMKRLTDEQSAFYKELNAEYQKHIEKHNNPTFMAEVKGIFSKVRNFMGLNEPQTHELGTNEDKYAFIQKFVIERFRHVKINRSSQDYISLDFGDNKKMRLFYDCAKVKTFENAASVKVEQNKQIGLMPVNESYKNSITAELNASYLYNLERFQKIEQDRAREIERKRLEKERKEKENQALIERQRKQAEQERNTAEFLKSNNKPIIYQYIDSELSSYRKGLFENSFVGCHKPHDFLYMVSFLPEKAVDFLRTGKFKEKLEKEYGSLNFDTLKEKEYLSYNVNNVERYIEQERDKTINQLKTHFIEFYTKASDVLFESFKEDVAFYKEDKKEGAFMIDKRPFALAFLNEVYPKIEQARQFLQENKHQEVSTNTAQPQHQPKPSNMRFKM